jgi:hypothetical protein
MSDSNRTPDASATAQERTGATEDYGGVPISESELAEVWTTGEGDEPAGENTGDDSATRAGADTRNDARDDTVVSDDAGESGDIKPEVPSDDPQPAEPA